MKYLSLTIIIALLALATFSSCGSGEAGDDSGRKTQISDSTKNDSIKNRAENKKAEEERVPVEVTSVVTGNISDYILLSSNLETERMADVYSRVQGLVETIFVEEGDHVKKGQVLAELEAAEYRLAAERARVNYLKQQSDFKRLKAMYEQELLSSEEFEQAKYQTDGLRIEWEQQKLNLDYTRITAPISGLIGDRYIKIGDRIQPTDRLFSVINNSEMICVVYVPEKELGRVQKNQKAQITSDNLSNRRYNGWVKRVSPVVDPQTGTFKVTIGVDNSSNDLRAGMFVNAHIITSTHTNAVLIPKTAIVYENEKLNVFVVRDSIAHKIELKVGFQDHEKIESLSGIEPGEKVIVVGQAGLKDKARVKIVSERKNDLAAGNIAGAWRRG